MTGSIARLRAAVRDSGSPLAAVLGDEPAPATAADAVAEPARTAAAGPRAAQARDEVELAVTAVHEGYRLHYSTCRALSIADPDLALLAGDRLYALGLARLADLGDLAAIAELADVIALSAQAHASGDPELADAAWEAGATAIGWGPDARSAAAKDQARAGAADAAAALRAAAQARREDA
ncbi:MAG: hypothetical protein QOE11_3288 [Solirubrobacteraceae bacterium]|jgi:hypothetical protein|nr:hypothetical protein [Solirubrobacteraceae bacterium]